MNRRELIGGMTLGAGGLLLSGCDKLNSSPQFRKILTSAEQLHLNSQRLVAGGLAREYRTDQMSPVFRTNGNTQPGSAAYAAHSASNFANWRLVIDGLVAKPLNLSLHDLGSFPQRAQITRHSLSAHDAVAAYSRLIAGLVELIFQVADAALLPQVSRLLVAFLHLVQGKEAAGQERAVGALLFGAGAGDDAQQQRVLHLIDAQERSLQVFADFTDPTLRARWEAMQLGPAVARLERLRRTLVSARPGAALDSNLSNDWFEITSERIGELWQLQGELVQHLREACAAQIAIAQQELTDAAGLLRGLHDNPPAHAHAVERFFDAAIAPEAAPEMAGIAPGSAAGGAASLLELLQLQSARLARMEAELEAARRTLHERKVIERAKGVLMSRLRMTEEAAFRALQKTSMDQNRRLLEVAEATLSLPDFAFGLVAGAPPAS